MKKELIKNFVYIFFILLVAVFSTYYIYYKFQNDRSVDYNSDSLNVIYHDTNGDHVEITKITPVTDSVGLSSNSYNFTIQNNMTIPVPYTIKIEDDLDKILEDECGNSLVSKDNIRISIKIGKGSNKIYNLDELREGVLYTDSLEALQKVDVVIRVWIKKDSILVSGMNLHYHGIIRVLEEEYIYPLEEVENQ